MMIALNYLKTLEDNSIDLILLDPPYFGIVEKMIGTIKVGIADKIFLELVKKVDD